MASTHYPSLVDKVVFVTGGASGIGADIVRAFHAQGARVGFVDLQDDVAARLIEDCTAKGVSARHDGGALQSPCYRHCDVTDIPALEAAIAEIAAELGPIGILVNNAANDTRTPIADIDVANWDASMAVNLRPHFFASRAVHAGMAALGGGVIINLSSIAWHAGMLDLAHYTAAKAGVIGLTHSLARTFGPDNIRVNAIEPGAVLTERQRELWYRDQAAIDRIVGLQILRHELDGSQIAQMALFLASDDARMITKQTFVVDAGIH